MAIQIAQDDSLATRARQAIGTWWSSLKITIIEGSVMDSRSIARVNQSNFE